MSGSTSPLYGPLYTSEVYVPDRLIAGDYPLVTDTVTIPAGEVLTRGSLLGMVTATGDYVLATSAATDGSQNPLAILADNVNTSATGTNAPTLAPVYLSGEFNVNGMTLGAGFTYPAIKAPLRSIGLYLKQGISGAPAN
jgi:hypothetical protein